MSNKVFKNYQINLGVPFQVKVPLEELLDGYYDTSGRLDLSRVAGGLDGLDGLGEVGDVGTVGGVGGQGGQDAFIANGLFAGIGVAVTPDGAVDMPNGAVEMPNGVEDMPNDIADIPDSARAEAESILGEARAESAEIIASANAEAQAAKEAAAREADAYIEKARMRAEAEAAVLWEQASREGEREGREEGKAAYDSLIDDAQRLKSEAQRLQDEAQLLRDEAERIKSEAEAEYIRLMDGAEGDALGLILDIAKKVIGDEIAQNRESLIYMIKDAFMHCTNKENVVLKVSPDDFDFVSQNRDMLLSMVEGLDTLEIKRDLALAAGSCQIETPFGNLDAGVQTRFSKIEGAFYGLLSTQRQPVGGYTAQ
ncbi:MAG: FliH/SctL family protein [Oscillospiraceae bacterium]|nr:FliH/SctL family protein [Oscillospiraceae bacterium]